jgi:hypothetical protein
MTKNLRLMLPVMIIQFDDDCTILSNHTAVTIIAITTTPFPRLPDRHARRHILQDLEHFPHGGHAGRPRLPDAHPHARAVGRRDDAV